MPKKIIISTTGGDAPGLNAVVKGATLAGLNLGFEMFGSRRGLAGMVNGDVQVLKREDVEDIEKLGGSILGSASTGPIFGREGVSYQEVVDKIQNQYDGLIIAGGDGSLKIAREIDKLGFPVVVVPKTIDRDVAGTFSTFGFATAVQTATDAIDRVHSTAKSHDRLMVVEVMGRDAGWIALYAGMAGGACMIAIPEIPYDLESFNAHIALREKLGVRHHILVCSEGAQPRGGHKSMSSRTGQYSGAGENLARQLGELSGKDARTVSLGHLLRGGTPCAVDRMLGMRFGTVAVEFLGAGQSGVMVGYHPPNFKAMPISEVVGQESPVEVEGSEVRTARLLGISFGD